MLRMIKHQYRPRPRRQPIASLTRTCQGDIRSDLTRKMAEAMREDAFAGQTVSIETLTARFNCSRRLVEELAPLAVNMARRASIKRIDGDPASGLPLKGGAEERRRAGA
jgi:hypothetical protein